MQTKNNPTQSIELTLPRPLHGALHQGGHPSAYVARLIRRDHARRLELARRRVWLLQLNRLLDRLIAAAHRRPKGIGKDLARQLDRNFRLFTARAIPYLVVGHDLFLPLIAPVA